MRGIPRRNENSNNNNNNNAPPRRGRAINAERWDIYKEIVGPS